MVPQIEASLMAATMKNISEFGPKAITGPAARGDHKVVRLQGAEVFRWHPEAGVIYHDLSRLARRLALQQTTHALDTGN